MTARFASDALALLLYVAVARRFGESGIGSYSFAFALAAMFSAAVEFGLRPLIARQVARCPVDGSRYAGTLLLVQTGLTVAVSGLLWSFIIVAGYPPQIQLLVMVAFLGVALNACGLSSVAVLEGLDAMDRSAKLELVLRSVTVLSGFLLLAANAPLVAVVGSQAIGGAVYLLIAVKWVRELVGPLRFTLTVDFVGSTLRDALPFFGASAIYLAYSRADVVLLHYLAGDVETGRYAVVVRFVSTPLMLGYLVGVAIYPRLAHAFRHDNAQLQMLFLGSLRWLGLIGVLGTVLFATAGAGVVVLLFGPEFAGAAELVPVMALLLFLGFVRIPYERLLFAANHERMQLVVELAALAVNLTLNVLLIPRYGAAGAAIAAVATQGGLMLSLHLLSVKLTALHSSAVILRLALLGCAAVTAGWVGRTLGFWPVGTALAFGVFLTGAFWLRLITRTDGRSIAEAWSASPAPTVPLSNV